MNGNKDPDDISLVNGGAYFVRWHDFEQYLATASKQPDVVSVFGNIQLLLWFNPHLCVVEIHLQLFEGRHLSKHFQVQQQGRQWRVCHSVCATPVFRARRNG
jgi:hypothetical protein